jgi:bleomycin hydrolase
MKTHDDVREELEPVQIHKRTGRGERPKRAQRRSADRSAAGADALGAPQIERMAADLDATPTYRILHNAVAEVPVSKIASRRDVVIEADHTFSVTLDSWPVTAQKNTGRCWMFAGLNILRPAAARKLKLSHFEFSQNYLMFWDKLEKANYFLEAMIDTADRPLGERTVGFLLRSPVNDGGQWDMFVNIVHKYGLVPKAIMPETESSSNSREMNRGLAAKLRQGAKQLRELAAKGAARAELDPAKQEILGAIYRILAIHLGTPPTRFDWQWRGKDKKVRRDTDMTPRKFAKKYASVDLDDYVCLVHDPREAHPYGRTYTVEYLGNVRGAGAVTYLNVEIDLMRKITLRTLREGEPVWFGCDCSQQMDRERGLWDANLRDYEAIYATDFELSKADRLLYGATAMNHAMVFTGVDLVKNQPRRWRVENSWGEEAGHKGYFLMNDSWFTEHMFEVAARKSYLPAKLQEALEQPPTVLPAWDPMGSLA